MMVYKKILACTILILFFINLAFCLPNAVQAADSGVVGLLKEAGGAAQYDISKTELYEVAGNFVRLFLSLLGVIFIVLAIYGGYLWMTAQGNTEQVDKAKQLLTNAFIGLIIILAAYAITYFAIYILAKDYAQNSGF